MAGEVRPRPERVTATAPADHPLDAGRFTTAARRITHRIEADLPQRVIDPRFLTSRVLEALHDTRVVGIVGPRQAGKSTLVQQLVHELARGSGATYVSLDDRDTRIASTDPEGFVSGRAGMLAIDEVQRVPELLIAIKAEVDRDQRPGRFLITGSSQPSANRDVAETLSGRIERSTLWPVSQGERTYVDACFVDRLFGHGIPEVAGSSMTKRDYLERALAGGFPEALARSAHRRAAWFDTYVETVVEREAPGIAASPRTADLPRLLRLVAARQAGLLNVANLAADAQLPHTSTQRYLDVLEAVFLIVRLPAWAPNLGKREIRAPKILLADPGLAAHLRHADLDRLALPELAKGADGPIIEGFVAAELVRIASTSVLRPQLSHYRDRRGMEVDLILETRGQVAAVEVKAGAGTDPTAARNLAALRDALGERFAAGVVLHTGPTGQRIGDRLYSMPISHLWEF